MSKNLLRVQLAGLAVQTVLVRLFELESETIGLSIFTRIIPNTEQHEPRFVGGLNECDGRIEGLHFLTPNQIEVRLYLNQMGVFNLVDDGTLPGCAALKLRFVGDAKSTFVLNCFYKVTEENGV